MYVEISRSHPNPAQRGPFRVPLAERYCAECGSAPRAPVSWSGFTTPSAYCEECGERVWRKIIRYTIPQEYPTAR